MTTKKLSPDQYYFLKNGDCLVITEYENFPLIGEIRDKFNNPYKQTTGYSISEILKHFKIKEYSFAPITRMQKFIRNT